MARGRVEPLGRVRDEAGSVTPGAGRQPDLVTTEPAPVRPERRRRLWATIASIALAWIVWAGWTETQPSRERELRVAFHEWLETRFTDLMAQDDGWHGLHLRNAGHTPNRPVVVLVHGLDEPGTIWKDLIPVLSERGHQVWELRYPNDQGIDRSAAFLASQWPSLDPHRPVYLVGHSMGGLVIREFVSLWRHPVDSVARLDGAAVGGVILGGTPNQGSEWARMRAVLEFRDQFPGIAEKRHPAFAGLRDGTGVAKIDLRPRSEFLEALNARAWPPDIPALLIAGMLSEASAALGDGVVALDSIALPTLAPPVIVNASHRGMFVRIYAGDAMPPAIPHVVDTLDRWTDVEAPAP